MLNSGVKSSNLEQNQLNSRMNKRISWAKEIEGNNAESENVYNNSETSIGNINSCDNPNELPVIQWDNIQDEIYLWQKSVVCYVHFGGNPPQNVIEGFFRRIWGKLGIDRIAAIGNGFCMVRLHSRDVRRLFWQKNVNSLMVNHQFLLNL